MVRATCYRAWADLLTYPAEAGRERTRARIDEITAAAPACGAALGPMAAWTESCSDTDLEEAFTRTFDSNAERALEVGWHLHGENYARGVFMVRMRALLREHGVAESAELPDHLSHVLAVLSRAEPDLARALATGVVRPALSKILRGFSDPDDPYRGVILGLSEFLAEEYPS